MHICSQCQISYQEQHLLIPVGLAAVLIELALLTYADEHGHRYSTCSFNPDKRTARTVEFNKLTILTTLKCMVP